MHTHARWRAAALTFSFLVFVVAVGRDAAAGQTADVAPPATPVTQTPAAQTPAASATSTTPPASTATVSASTDGQTQSGTSSSSSGSTTTAASQTHDSMAMPPADETYPNLKIIGFGDLDYTQTKYPEGPKGFSEGQFVLHLVSALSPRVTFFGELSLTARADAGTGTPPAPGFNAEVERMIVRFEKNDHVKVSFGRYHTPINWWNTTFHHGQWLQTTIARPEMIEFGGKFLPVHFVGALFEGSVPAHGWNVNYTAGIGNGRGDVISRAGDAGDINGNRAWLVNTFVRPDWAYGLQFGASYYADLITLPSAQNFGENIVSGHVVWTKEDPEFIAEYAGVRHVAVGTNDANWSHAYYAQFAYRLHQFKGLWKPYYRFEHIDINANDVVFAGVPQLDGSTLGVRYDASPLAALKFEFRTWTRGPDSLRNYGGFFQLCFTF